MQLGIRAKGRKVVEAGTDYQLRELRVAYRTHFDPENDNIGVENTYHDPFLILAMQTGCSASRRGPPADKFNDKNTDLLLPFRPMAENSSHLLRRLSLTQTRNLEAVVFDKTGTMTEGRFGVGNDLSVDKEEISKLSKKGKTVVYVLVESSQMV
ncbi:MAG: hypothetical protein JSW26_17925 [Desulfobacterales bacterium]|nr:MAG: hypothetical protein JSW26_17925 [Desulfobacterales bacterium]